MQPEIVLATLAVVPPLVVALVLVRRGPGDERAWLAGAVAFTWSAAVATTIAELANDTVGAHVGTVLGSEGARRTMSVLVGPLVEEVAKATAFAAVAFVRPRALDGVWNAVAIGVLAGLGFTAAENVVYYTLAAVQGGWVAVGRALWIRGVVQLPIHALFGAVVGVAVGWVRRPHHPRGILAAGLVAAVLLHAVWNGLLSALVTDVLCNAPTAGAACGAAPDTSDLLVRVPALVLAFVVPAGIALAWAARQLDAETGRGVRR